ncbi:uncharacterized protein [Henckelia pumila]|uniref:uncharacterized protein n=1 Tax=Henckelia pumila TaxID=405737 RepID=UPI003C6E9A73
MVPSLLDKIRTGQSSDQQVLTWKHKNEAKCGSLYTVKDGIVHHKGRMLIPAVDSLREEVMTETHTVLYSIHPGSTKMFKDLQKLYWWPGMKKDIVKFVNKCLTCQQVKVEHQRPAGLLKPLPIPTWKWEDVTIDFVVGLPTTPRRMNSIWALYGRKFRNPLHWDEVGERAILGPEIVQQTVNMIAKIKDKMLTAQSHQKSYADQRRRDLEFQVGDHVFLKVSPWKGVLRFGKKRKLSPRYIGSFEILDKVGARAYRVSFPPNQEGVHNVFHISMLRKYIANPSHIIHHKPVQWTPDLSYEETPVQILDKRVRKLRNK